MQRLAPLFSEASIPPAEALSHSSRIRWDQRHVWMSEYYDTQEKPAGEWKKKWQESMNDINPGLALHNVPAQHTVPCSVLESIKLQRSSNNTAINTPRARYSSMGNPHHTMEDLRHGGPGSRKRRNSRPLAVGERFRLRQSAPTQPSSKPKKYIQNNSPTTEVLSPKHPGDLFSNPVEPPPRYSCCTLNIPCSILKNTSALKKFMYEECR